MGFQKVFGHREKVIIGELVTSGPLYPYTKAFVLQVIANGGFVTNAEINYLHTFETSMGSDLAEFDRLWIHGLKNVIAAKTSFVNPSSTMITTVNSPTFTPSEGFTGNGISTYLNTNYNPYTQGVKFTTNSCCSFYYSRTSGIYGTKSFGGSFDNTYLTSCILPLYPNISSLTGLIWQNMTAGAPYFPNNTLDSKGLFSANRLSNNVSFYINGSLQGTNLYTNFNPVNLNLFTLGINNFGNLFFPTVAQISFVAQGSGNINQSNFYNSVQTLGTSLGWAV